MEVWWPMKFKKSIYFLISLTIIFFSIYISRFKSIATIPSIYSGLPTFSIALVQTFPSQGFWRRVGHSAWGVFTADFQPAAGHVLLKNYDNFMQLYTESTEDSADIDSENTFTPIPITPSTDDFDDTENELDDAARLFIEEIWNGETIQWSYVGNSENNFFGNPKNVFMKLLKNSFLSIEPVGSNGLNHALIALNIDDLLEIFNELCPENSAENATENSAENDLCSSQYLNGNLIREKTEEAIASLSDNFQIQLHFYWAIRDKNIFASNQKNVVLDSIDKLLKDKRDESISNQLLPAFENAKNTIHSTSKIINTHRLAQSLQILVSLLREESLDSDLYLSDLFAGQESQDQFFNFEIQADKMMNWPKILLFKESVGLKNSNSVYFSNDNTRINQSKKLDIINSILPFIFKENFKYDRKNVLNFEKWSIIEDENLLQDVNKLHLSAQKKQEF